jgi:hypothetical protein
LAFDAKDFLNPSDPPGSFPFRHGYAAIWHFSASTGDDSKRGAEFPYADRLRVFMFRHRRNLSINHLKKGS